MKSVEKLIKKIQIFIWLLAIIQLWLNLILLVVI